MAYMTQELKAKIAAQLKLVAPVGWKYSLRVQHHSTIVCTITRAPLDLIGAFKASQYFDPATATDCSVNPYHYRDWIADECVADVIGLFIDALNLDNHDNSDIQTDYFDVGHYISLHIGAYDKPFVMTSPTPVVLRGACIA